MSSTAQSGPAFSEGDDVIIPLERVETGKVEEYVGVVRWRQVQVEGNTKHWSYGVQVPELEGRCFGVPEPNVRKRIRFREFL